MSEAEEEDAIGGTCECEEEIEILVGSEGASRKNGIGSSVPRGSDSPTRTDVDNSYLPPFNDDIALLILARLPSSKYCDLRLVNQRFRSLIRSGELNKIRKKIGLTCGECYDFERNIWKLIPKMIEYYSVDRIIDSQPPNLTTVVNNELYYLEFPSRHLKVYLKNNNTWKKVGRMPESIEHLLGGRRVALKSLENQLLLIGRTTPNPSTPDTLLCFCTPSPKLDDVEWHVLDFHRPGQNQSLYNCCVMML